MREWINVVKQHLFEYKIGDFDLGGASNDPNDPAHFVEPWIKKFGLGFHPDTRGADYVDREFQRVLSDTEAAQYDADMEDLFDWSHKHGSDPYEVGLQVMHRLGLVDDSALRAPDEPDQYAQPSTRYVVDYYAPGEDRPSDGHPDHFDTQEEAEREAEAFMQHVPWADRWKIRKVD